MLAAFPSTNMTTLKQEHLLGGYTIRQTLYENLNQRCMLSHNLQSNDEIRNLFYVLHSQRIWQKARWMWRELNQNHTYSNQFLWHRCLPNESHQQFFDVPSGGGASSQTGLPCGMHHAWAAFVWGHVHGERQLPSSGTRGRGTAKGCEGSKYHVKIWRGRHKRAYSYHPMDGRELFLTTWNSRCEPHDAEEQKSWNCKMWAN